MIGIYLICAVLIALTLFFSRNKLAEYSLVMETSRLEYTESGLYRYGKKAYVIDGNTVLVLSKLPVVVL